MFSILCRHRPNELRLYFFLPFSVAAETTRDPLHTCWAARHSKFTFYRFKIGRVHRPVFFLSVCVCEVGYDDHG